MTSVDPLFPGFLPGGPVIALPAQLLAEVLPAIEDEAELRVTLQLWFLVGLQRGAVPLLEMCRLCVQEQLVQCGDIQQVKPLEVDTDANR